MDTTHDGYAFVAGTPFKLTPSGFLPVEDQGSCFVEVTLPEGASVNRISALMPTVTDILNQAPAVESIEAVIGFNFVDGLS